uniref:PX domain-containing protein n=1 Tax=Spongospora subterranea TaxID=70186 RepID=A0A0H5QZI3_9EUKA|eukprot:CRZ00974.1 hypothetical protein [Spongospora subterranea]
MVIHARVQASRTVEPSSVLTTLVNLVRTVSLPSDVVLQTHTAYVIIVDATCDDGTRIHAATENRVQWILNKRYSTFSRLHSALSTNFRRLPPLPPKKFGFNMEAVFVEERRNALDNYLSQLMKIEAVLQSEELGSFLELNDHGVQLMVPHRLVADTILSDPKFGVRAMCCRDEFVFTGCEDLAIFHRLDSLLTNAKFPWEKQGAIVPVGSVNVWTRNAQEEWSVCACAYFPDPSCSIEYNPQLRQVFVGLVSGVLHVYTLSTSRCDLVDRISLILHSRAISALRFLPDSSVLISCSLDHTISMLHVDPVVCIARIELGSPVLTCEPMPNRNVLLVGTATQIVIIDVTGCQFCLIGPLPESTGNGCYATLHYSYKERALFAGDKRQCIVRMLNKVDSPVSSFRVVAQLSSGPTSAVTGVTFSERFREIYTSHSNGSICVWNSQGTGEIKYVIRAHGDKITALLLLEPDRLVSASLDGNVMFWKRAALDSQHIKCQNEGSIISPFDRNDCDDPT